MPGGHRQMARGGAGRRNAVASLGGALARSGGSGPSGQALERERAYQLLRRKIILLELTPGSVLQEPELTGALGIGRTPVHESLLRLSREGFVRIMPRRGMIVTEMSLYELQQVYEGRTVLEPSTTRLAAQRATPEEVERLTEALDRADRLIEARDFQGVLEADEAFHLGLVSASRNNYLVDTIHTLHSLAARFWYLSLLHLPIGLLQAQMRDHRGVLRAVAQGDAAAAEAAMRALISRFPNDLAGVLASPPEPTSAELEQPVGVGKTAG